MSSEDASRVLLDTSFILPTLGIDTGERVSEGLNRLGKTGAEIYYSRFSILEALWVAAKVSGDRKFDTERFRLGLRSIMESGRYIKVDEDSEVFDEAMRLHMLGHKDIIDNIIYASSIRLNLKLLTLDTELGEFIRKRGLKDTLIAPNQIP
ncbi:MAG: PIN domain-containing protein [Candidatus Bathyarchaeia archaeon]